MRCACRGRDPQPRTHSDDPRPARFTIRTRRPVRQHCRRRRRHRAGHHRGLESHRLRRPVPGDSHHEPASDRLGRPQSDRGLSRWADPDRARRRLERRRDRGQDLSCPDRRRRIPQAPPRPVPRPAGCPIRRSRPGRQPSVAGRRRSRGQHRRAATRRRPERRRPVRAARPLPSRSRGDRPDGAS